MCRRRTQQIYIANPSPYQAKRQRHGCCSSRRQARFQAEAALTSINDPHTQLISGLARDAQYVETSHPVPIVSIGHRKQCHSPISGMASALILGLGLGAQKIKEKRDERKQKKASLKWEEDQASSSSSAQNAHPLVDSRREMRKSEEARQERGRAAHANGDFGRQRTSESLEREGEDVPPPSYEDVVGTGRRQ